MEDDDVFCRLISEAAHENEPRPLCLVVTVGDLIGANTHPID